MNYYYTWYKKKKKGRLHSLWTGGREWASSFLPLNCRRIEVIGLARGPVAFLLSRSTKIAAIKEGARIYRKINRDIDGCSPRESNVGLLGQCGGIDLHGCGLNIKKSIHDFSQRVKWRSFRNMRGDEVAKYMNTHSQ